jgi:hypothetical protein
MILRQAQDKFYDSATLIDGQVLIVDFYCEGRREIRRFLDADSRRFTLFFEDFGQRCVLNAANSPPKGCDCPAFRPQRRLHRRPANLPIWPKIPN